MSLIALYLGTKYDVCECNSLRDMTINSIFVTFDLHLWPSSSFKVTFIFIIRWTLYCCVFVSSTKFVGSMEFEIWTIVWRKLKWRHNDVISHSNFTPEIQLPPNPGSSVFNNGGTHKQHGRFFFKTPWFRYNNVWLLSNLCQLIWISHASLHKLIDYASFKLYLQILLKKCIKLDYFSTVFVRSL